MFLALEVALTLCIAVIKVPYTGFFKYFNYTVQGLGLGFAIYSIIRFVLSYTSIIGLINEKLANRRVNKKSKILRNEEKPVSSKVEETIAKETNIDDIDTDVEFVSKASKEPEVIGIEYIKEKEVSTPYMEEEL